TIFGPRNEAIHNYELVDIKLAEKAYQLSNLTLKNCRNTENPTIAPVLYGNLEFYRNADAISKLQEAGHLREHLSKSAKMRENYLSGLGPRGSCSVYFERRDEESRVVLFESHGSGQLEARYCKTNQFSSEQIRSIFQHLESRKPVSIELSQQEVETINN